MELPPKSELPFGLEKLTDEFTGFDIYYSGSIRGVVPDPLIGYEVVSYILQNGGQVLSAHVAARNVDERKAIFAQMSGRDSGEKDGEGMNEQVAYEVDMAWVDQASHVVAIVDSPSFGVGMEIQRALLKQRLGLNPTPVLCLVREENFNGLSAMIRGATFEFGNMIQVKTYTSAEDAKEVIHDFLLGINEG